MKSPFLSLVFLVVGTFPLEAQGTGAVAFEDLKAMFKKHCLTCHNGERPRGGLDMTTKAAILAGSDSGVSLVAGKPDESLLFKLAAHLEAPHMPPNAPKMPDRDLEQIKNWILLGMPERKDLAKLDPKLVASLSKPSAILPAPAEGSAMAAGGSDGPGRASGAARNGAKAASAVGSSAQDTARVQRVAPTSLAFSQALGGYLRPVKGGAGVVDEQGALLKILPFPEKEITKIRVGAEGALVLLAGGEGAQTGRVELINAADGTKRFATADELDTVLAADLAIEPQASGASPRGLVALSGPSKVVKVFSLGDGKLVHAMKKHIDWVLDLRFGPDGLLLASADRSGTILLTEAAGGAEVHVLRGHQGAVPTIAWKRDGNVLVSGGADGKIRMWDAHFGKDLGIFDAHEGGVTQVEVLADGRVLSAGRDKKLKVWSPDLKQCEVVVTSGNTPLSFACKPGKIGIGESDGKLTWVVLASDRLAHVPGIAITDKKDPEKHQGHGAPENATTQAETTAMASALERKRELLKTLESASEKLKDDAARTPENKDLAEGYIQICRTILAVKSEIVRLEKAAVPEVQGSKQ